MPEPLNNALTDAREILCAVTPLQTDCGALCDASCCRPPDWEAEDEESGMLLFPGEDTFYSAEDAAWMKIIPSGLFLHGESVGLLVCDKPCPRERRPLSCRFFPLAPHFRAGLLSVVMDARGGPLCPLVDSGVRGVQKDFAEKVEEAFEILSRDGRQKEFLHLIDRQIRAHKKMIRSLSRSFSREDI